MYAGYAYSTRKWVKHVVLSIGRPAIAFMIMADDLTRNSTVKPERNTLSHLNIKFDKVECILLHGCAIDGSIAITSG